VLIKISRASVPGRICFLGEHLDWVAEMVEGVVGASLLGAIDLRVSVEIRDLPDNDGILILRSNSPYNIEKIEHLATIGDYTGDIFDYARAATLLLIRGGLQLEPIEIDISSTLPPEAGLSSSAAVTLATLAALNHHFTLGFSPYELCALGYKVEADELSTGAGQMDFYACAFGKVMYVDCSENPPRSMELYNFPTMAHYRLVVVDTRTPRRTRSALQLLRTRVSENDDRMLEYINFAQIAVSKGRELFRNDETKLSEIGELLTLSHRKLKENVGVSTELLDTCVELSLEAGGLGGKLSGTGFGGCMFALAHESIVESIVTRLKELPVDIYVTSFSPQGIKYG
jgi:galactokinase